MNAIPYAYDFVSLIFDNPEARKHIRHAILFGSAATGEMDRKSDVDIFIDVPGAAVERIEPAVKDAEKRFFLSVDRKWSLLGIINPVRYIIDDIEAYQWKEIRSEIISTGIVLYGKYEGLKEGLKHYALFIYSLSGLEQNKKMAFIREMFGYRLRKGKKTYETKGLLAEIGGSKLGRSLLIPVGKARVIQKRMAAYSIKHEIREIWIK